MCSKPFKRTNQDDGCVYEGEHCSAVAIADGVGSSADAHIASRVAVRKFLAGVRVLDEPSKPITIELIQQIWDHVAGILRLCYKKRASQYQGKPNVMRTTMVTVIDLADRYIISYLGNGSILHIRGDVWGFWGRRWPWCVTELMLGHSFLSATGKDTLDGFLAPTGLTAKVRFLQLWKDTEYGEILVLCSDGINSPDNLRIGHDANDKLWVEVNPHIEVLINDVLKQYFEQEVHRSETMQRVDSRSGTEKPLAEFLNNRTFDDDATIGLIVSRQARDFYIAKHRG